MNEQWLHDALMVQTQVAGRGTLLRGISAGGAAAILAAAGPSQSSAAGQEATPRATDDLFLLIRLYRLAPGATVEEGRQRTQEGFLPIIQEVPGFVAYSFVDLGTAGRPRGSRRTWRRWYRGHPR